MFAHYLNQWWHSLLTHWGRDEIDAFLHTIFSNVFSWMKMLELRLKFYWNLFPRVQSTIFQHWFRWWFGAEQATSNSPVTGEFPTQMACNAENVSIWWRHHECGKNIHFMLSSWSQQEWHHPHQGKRWTDPLCAGLKSLAIQQFVQQLVQFTTEKTSKLYITAPLWGNPHFC